MGGGGASLFNQISIINGARQLKRVAKNAQLKFKYQSRDIRNGSILWPTRTTPVNSTQSREGGGERREGASFDNVFRSSVLTLSLLRLLLVNSICCDWCNYTSHPFPGRCPPVRIVIVGRRIPVRLEFRTGTKWRRNKCGLEAKVC